MPSVFHQMVVDMFHHRAELAPELLATCADLKLDHAQVKLTSIDLSQVTSTEYRADAVVELRDHGNALVSAVVAEVQLGIDPDKRLTWPVYVTALRARLKRPVTLLVFTDDPIVARWARRPIAIGHPGFHLDPVVVAFDDLPRSIDSAIATKLPELAVLSAMAHPELEIATTAFDAIAELPEDQNRLYSDLILSKLPDPLRSILEARMKGYEYQSDFARKYYYQGHNEGLEKGRKEGLRMVVRAFLRKLVQISADDLAAIDTIDDEAVLTELAETLECVSKPFDARAALDIAISASCSR
jgi:hypothetical protein